MLHSSKSFAYVMFMPWKLWLYLKVAHNVVWWRKFQHNIATKLCQNYCPIALANIYICIDKKQKSMTER